MTLRHLITFLGLLSFLLGGCSKQSAPPRTQSPDAPVLKVAVFADGRLTVNGSAATILSLQASLHILSEKHGVVWYYREAGQQEPPTIAMDVMKTVAEARLPIRLSSRPDYSDAIGAKPDKGYVVDSDPEMAAAIAKAQETLPQFWRCFDQRAHGESNFVLVVRFTDKGRIEHFHTTDFERRDGKTLVTIRSDPKVVSSVKRGDRIEIPAADITDWRYVRDGKEVGLLTAKVLLKHMPVDQAQALKKL